MRVHVCFFKSISSSSADAFSWTYSRIVTSDTTEQDLEDNRDPMDDYIFMGETFADVEFKDVREQQIEALREQITKVQAEARAKCTAIESRIGELLALDAPGGEA